MFSWFKQMVSAVAYIHEKGFIHRDLKVSMEIYGRNSFQFQPSNILFAGTDQLKVCDLGIATQYIFEGEDHDENSARTKIGTPIYQAPEQARF